MSTYILVVGKFPGKHCWPNAPEVYKELRELHFHEFHFKAIIEVSEARQIEFLDLASAIARSMPKILGCFPSLSCEALARHLSILLEEGQFELKTGSLPALGKAVKLVEVTEDGLCGGVYMNDGVRDTTASKCYYTHITPEEDADASRDSVTNLPT